MAPLDAMTIRLHLRGIRGPGGGGGPTRAPGGVAVSAIAGEIEEQVKRRSGNLLLNDLRGSTSALSFH